MNRERVKNAFKAISNHLIEEMNVDGFWEGYLSSSALSTATAVSALSLAKVESDSQIIDSGISWLASSQNSDGGWGDTTDSPSNLSTTLLAICAIRIAGNTAEWAGTIENADNYVSRQTQCDLVSAIKAIYGKDRTFAVPILMNCALAGLVEWKDVPGLPFELAIFPRSWYKALKLQVVSYALPALIAVGMVIHKHAPSGNPLVRILRNAVRSNVLNKLARIQPENGGFLEATPLTSFVAMSLIPTIGKDHSISQKCLVFIRGSQREDGSWPIDTNLSAWVTTSAVSALANVELLDSIDQANTLTWIEARQYHEVHPFTGAAPGGFGWTHLPGGVPDGDDTSGAILAMMKLGANKDSDSVRAAIKWLIDLQNADGGWPTFCRGWGQLPFDKSSPDITAHALRALKPVDPEKRFYGKAIERGFTYLSRSQRKDGSWSPLWFGNQSTSDKSNPVFGTSRVIPAFLEYNHNSAELQSGVDYLLRVQNTDGGWGGDVGVSSTIEETALAVTALSGVRQTPEVQRAVLAGAIYLADAVERKRYLIPSSIGLYFASLWYSEKLYPVIWAVEALGRVLNLQYISENQDVHCAGI